MIFTQCSILLNWQGRPTVLLDDTQATFRNKQVNQILAHIALHFIMTLPKQKFTAF